MFGRKIESKSVPFRFLLISIVNNTGAENVAKALIDNGADLNSATDQGELLIHLAARHGTLSLAIF